MPNTNKTKSPAVVALEEETKAGQEQPTLVLSQEQKDRLNANIEKINRAKRQRDQKYDYFDSRTYEEDYVTNERASNTYLRPKINDDEVRVATPTTEKRGDVISNEVLAMNLQPEAVAYDLEDNEIKELGRDMMDIVKRTEDLEKAEDFWEAFLRELRIQRAAFFEEVDEYIVINKRPTSPNSPNGYQKEKFPTGRPQIIHRAVKNHISGMRVYLGDISIPAYLFQYKQPYICVYTRRTYAATKSIYQKWSRWEHVNAGKGSGKTELNPMNYRMNDIGEQEVEEIKVLDPINNEYDIILNGIPMMENSTPLPYTVLPGRRYNIQMIVSKMVSPDFAYGKADVATAKTLQAVDEEILRDIIRKFRQGIDPALGTTSGQIYSKDILEASNVVEGIEPGDIFKLDPENKGVTNSEFSVYQLIKKEVEEAIGQGSLQSGQAASGEQTATEIEQLQTNALKQLGMIVAAFMRAKRDAPLLRIYNLWENFTKPTKRLLDPTSEIITDVFERFTITAGTFSDGTKGKKVVQFADRLPTPEEEGAMFDFEQSETKKGRPTRIRVINVKALAKLPIMMHIVVNRQRREGSALERIMSRERFQEAVEIGQVIGRQPNPDKVIEEFNSVHQVSDYFLPPQQQGQQASPEEQQLSNEIGNADRSATGSKMTEGVRAPIQRQSLSELMKTK